MTFATILLSTALSLAQSLLAQAQSGHFDRTVLTSGMSGQLTQEQAQHFAGTVGQLGKPSSFVLESKTIKGSYTKYTYRVTFAQDTIDEQLVLDGAGKVAGLWFTPAPVAAAPGDASALVLAKTLLRQAQSGSLDRAQLTSQAAASFTSDATARMKEQLAPLGTPSSFTLQSRTKDGGGTTYYYRVAFTSTGMYEEITLDARGKVAGLWFKPAH